MRSSIAHLLASVTTLLLPLAANSETLEFNFDIGWTYANPDSTSRRPVIGINGQWPIPTISVTKGDQVIVHAKNSLGNATTSLHFHGLYMNGTTEMDGPPGVTQCEISPGSTFTYNFTVDQPGTYWYHSHTRGQYPDGLRGPFIVKDPDSPFKDEYDEEIVLTFSDWYHDLMKGLIDGFVSVTNPTGAEPVPNAALMGDTQDHSIKVEPGKTYLVRMINMGAFAAQYVWFEGHDMRVVEVDGVYTKPSKADMLYLTAAQRYSVLITTKKDASSNFAIVGSMDEDLFDAVPPTLNPNVTGWLVYDQDKPLPEPAMIDEFDPFDDFTLVPHDKMDIFDHVDHSITFNLKMDNLGDGANYAFLNDITYVGPVVPTLYTSLTTGENATDAEIYGVNTNPHILQHGDVIELVLNNHDPGKHPFHLHGHNFQVVYRSKQGAGSYSGAKKMPKSPMRRDTVLVNPNGNIVLRFRADNPGIWLFHCHLEWHVVSGLSATLIEAPLALQQSLTIPENHYEACRAADTPVKGNAAGNTEDVLDLSGANVSPSPIPDGFTTSGKVAMAFSILSAFLGMAAVSWYGMAPLGKEGR